MLLLDQYSLTLAFLFLSGHRSVNAVSADTLTMNGMSPVRSEIKRLFTVHTHTNRQAYTCVDIHTLTYVWTHSKPHLYTYIMEMYRDYCDF